MSSRPAPVDPPPVPTNATEVLSRGHLLLEDPTVVPGHRALHLRYRVRR